MFYVVALDPNAVSKLCEIVHLFFLFLHKT